MLIYFRAKHTIKNIYYFIFKHVLVFFFKINVGVRVNLHTPQLISQVLKLTTTMQTSSDSKICKTPSITSKK